MSFFIKITAVLSLLISQAALAFETCLPPECKAPIALDWPGAFGSSSLDKILMAAGVLCSWLIVWGLFTLIGRRPRRRASFLISDPEAKAFWEAEQDRQAADWKAIYNQADSARSARQAGALMLVVGLALSWLIVKTDSQHPTPNLSGSIARLQRFEHGHFVHTATLRLGPGGAACSVSESACYPWGQWFANGQALILEPAGLPNAFKRLVADDSNVRYWAKPGPDRQLTEAAFIDLPQAAETPPSGFKAPKGAFFD